MVTASSHDVIASGLFTRNSNSLSFEKIDTQAQERFLKDIMPKQGIESIENGEELQKVKVLQATVITSFAFSELLRAQDVAYQPDSSELNNSASADNEMYLVLDDSYKQNQQANIAALDSRQARIAEATASIQRLKYKIETVNEINAENRELIKALDFLIEYRKPVIYLDFMTSQQGDAFSLERIVNGQNTGTFTTEYQSVKDAILSHLEHISNINETSRRLGLIA